VINGGYLDAEGGLVAALALHLVLDGVEMGTGHVEVAGADVARVLEVRRRPDHAPVYPEPRLGPLALTAGPRPLLGQAAREPLDPHLARARHLAALLLRRRCGFARPALRQGYSGSVLRSSVTRGMGMRVESAAGGYCRPVRSCSCVSGVTGPGEGGGEAETPASYPLAISPADTRVTIK
jgi:hypothetical protein